MNKYFQKLRNKKNIFLNYMKKKKKIGNNLIGKRYVTKDIKNQKIIGKKLKKKELIKNQNTMSKGNEN